MIRVRFSAEDLARVVFLGEVLPQMGEAVLSLQILRRGDQRLRYGPWREQLKGRIPAAVRPLAELVPARGWIPDFLTPVVDGPQAGPAVLDAIRATGRRRLGAELGRLVDGGPMHGWLRMLAQGDAGALAVVTEALAAWHELAIAPHARRMQAVLDADLAQKATVLTRQGVGALLGRIHPAIAWEPPVLTLPSPLDADVDLAGRGLALAPMLFCGPLPRLLLGDGAGTGDGGMPVLAYQLPFDPVADNPLATASEDRLRQADPALSRLLGATRSAVLRAIVAAPGLSTAQLAHRADVALASASEHATTLRQAGLIISLRDGNRVRHYPTATATGLLDAPRPGPRAVGGPAHMSHRGFRKMRSK